ncbi:MAG: hypothetical protein ACR2OE_12840, partial [Thermomicrobiales bacterium]
MGDTRSPATGVRRALPPVKRCLTLQFPFFPSALTVGFLGAALVMAAPARPGNDRRRGRHHGPDQAHEESP